MMTTALVKAEPQSTDALMPALTIEQTLQRRDIITSYCKKVMQEGHDFGKIPGTDKDTLLKPGAEKLCTLFGLAPRFEILQRVEDWTGKDHGGEPFFYYLVKCRLHRGERVMGEGDGSCNSWESRYRYRKADRLCPECGQAAIIKGKAEYGGGHICFKKKGGCGAKFQDGDPAIESQQVGKVKNADVADMVNTFLKMAEKRALVSATLITTNASEFYTQDTEDSGVIDAEYTPAEPRRPEPSRQQPAPANGNGQKKQPTTGADFSTVLAQVEGKWVEKGMCETGEVVHRMVDWAKSKGCLRVMAEWPADLIHEACVYLKVVGKELEKRKENAEASKELLDDIDSLADKMYFTADAMLERIKEILGAVPGAKLTEAEAQKVKAAFQQQLQEMEKEKRAKAEAEIPF